MSDNLGTKQQKTEPEVTEKELQAISAGCPMDLATANAMSAAIKTWNQTFGFLGATTSGVPVSKH